jgi:hypothetical protein
MADQADRSKKSIKEHVEELWQDVLDTLESLVTPEPELIPVRVRRPQRPYRR